MNKFVGRVLASLVVFCIPVTWFGVLEVRNGSVQAGTADFPASGWTTAASGGQTPDSAFTSRRGTGLNVRRATPQSVVHATQSIRVLVNGASVPAIRVGTDETYVAWNALKILHTPYAYEGNGAFDVTNGTIYGVIYKGTTYVPWNQLAPKVKAIHVSGGGFNFVSVPVHHDYQIYVDSADGSAINETTDASQLAPLMVTVQDGNNPVPNQSVHITLSGNATFSGYQNQSEIHVTTSPQGYDVYGVNDSISEKVTAFVTWTDPAGKSLTTTANLTFKPAASSVAAVPGGESAIATIPVTVYQDSVLLNLTTDGHRQMFLLDTGAQMPLINREMASELHLPNLGGAFVQGVTGQNQAYYSEITFTLGGKTFTKVPCMVDESYTGTSLLGFHFFVENGYDALLSEQHDTLTLLNALPPSSSGSSASQNNTGDSAPPANNDGANSSGNDNSNSSGNGVSPSTNGTGNTTSI